MNLYINGETAVYGVIGDPVSHSFSPQIHRYFAAQSGVNAAYVPFHVKGGDIKAALIGAKALGIRGLNVTVPHKQAVMPFMDWIDPAAERVGSVNTVVFTKTGLAGYNTDWIGITRTLAAQGLSFANRPVTVFGAGGSAYAACMAAAEGGAKSIAIINRTAQNAAVLAAHVKKYYTVAVHPYDLAHFPPAEPGSVVMQTTTLGFGSKTGQSPVAGVSYFNNVELAFDFVYIPWETRFLQQAAEAGVKTVNGFPMLVYQAAASFVCWQSEICGKTGKGAPSDEELSAPPHMDALARLFTKRLHAG